VSNSCEKPTPRTITSFCRSPCHANRLSMTSRTRTLYLCGCRNYPRWHITLYKTLQHSDSIRVLEILSGRREDPIWCVLKEVSGAGAAYKALSYAWGEPVFSERLGEISSGTCIRITKTLHDAIRTIRSRNGTQNLWIDAVCIDQSSVAEKNHQVKNMASVYRQASEVIVWLGTGPWQQCGYVIRCLANIAVPAISQLHT
jgi:hypothetical protein